MVFEYFLSEQKFLNFTITIEKFNDKNYFSYIELISILIIETVILI